ncbi:hypothetical protein [Klebsiella oxytoca]|uniref:hypothetical protein n=1 Tax=Klebsiella oxytoca TaxID=571 RepID=UPI001CCBBDA8|nr:hypothetical protein [Klebsiella oxytoca]MBZ7479902.1 hypothetical protein [Klebsiella oxytoca]
MQVEETHWLDNGYVFNIPPKNYRRRIVVPVLMAIAPNGKAHAKHKLYFNGTWVAEAKADGTTSLEGWQSSGAGCNSWNTYIEANQSVSIQAVQEKSGDGYALPSITVMLGRE